jgi:hypothetical protein
VTRGSHAVIDILRGAWCGGAQCYCTQDAHHLPSPMGHGLAKGGRGVGDSPSTAKNSTFFFVADAMSTHAATTSILIPLMTDCFRDCVSLMMYPKLTSDLWTYLVHVQRLFELVHKFVQLTSQRPSSAAADKSYVRGTCCALSGCAYWAHAYNQPLH